MKFTGLKFFGLLIASLVLLNIHSSYAQDDDDLIFGRSSKLNSAALFDLSDPNGVNIEVNLWGFVRHPGKYRIPINTTFLDVMSYAGGPIEESNLEEIRILRNADNVNGKPELIKLNYNDFLWEERLSSTPKMNPVLKSGDVILVMEEKRFTFRDNVSFILPVVTSIVTIATLIITLTKN